MKKLYYVILAVLVPVLASCSGFLDIRTEASLPVSGMDYTKSENIFQPVSAAYASLRLDEGEALNYVAVLEIVSDDADKGSSATDGPTVQELDQFSYTPENSNINAVWEFFFEVVSQANYALESMDKFEKEMSSDADLKLISECRGEARIIRAYAYFNLVRIFGSVPKIDSSMSASDLNSLSAASVADLYKFIYDDLDAAIATVPDAYPDYPGRFTKYTAMALKTKVALYNRDWNECARLADEIIASERFDLVPKYRDVFSMQYENSVESLMELQSSTLGQTSGDAPLNFYAFIQGPRNNTPSNMQGWGFKVPSESLVKFLNDRGDTQRYAGTILERGTTTPEGDEIKDNCENPYYNAKVYTPSRYNNWSYNGYGFDYNMRIIRYAEILLMYAEALANNAPVGAKSGLSADDALGKVRDRAGLPATTATLENIYDERRAELALEENRFFDLVRWGKAAEVLGPLGFTAGKNEVFPVPSAQRQVNPNLPTTPGYTY